MRVIPFGARVRRFVTSAGAALLMAVLAVPAQSQTNEPRRWTFDIGGGVTPPAVGELHGRLNTGGHLKASGGLNFGPASAGVEFMWTGLGIDESVARAANVPDASGRMFSLGPVFKLHMGDRTGINPYLVGGAAWYRRTIDFTRPAIGQDIVYDPYWGYIPIQYQTNEVLATQTRDAFGGSLGFGLEFPFGINGGRLFTEARYHHINTANRSTQLIPVTFGLRW